jgi:hypothetical protein
MKIKSYEGRNGAPATFAFFPETEEEMRIIGSLRNAFFFGDEKQGTYPEYDGKTSQDNFVTSIKFTIPARSKKYVKQGSKWQDVSFNWDRPEEWEAGNVIHNDVKAVVNQINEETQRFNKQDK